MKHFTILFLLAASIMQAATDSVLVVQSNKRDIDPHSFLPPRLRRHQIQERFPGHNTTAQSSLNAQERFDPPIDRLPNDPDRNELNSMPTMPSKGLAGSNRNKVGSTVQSLPDSVQQAWVAHYNGPGNFYDEAIALAIDASGNVYVTGYSIDSGTDYDYTTVKYNASGVQQWVARYDGPANSSDYAIALAIDASGNVYVTGGSSGAGTDYDYATVKYDASGAQQWVARYDGPANDEDRAIALALDASGNIYVTGFSSGSGTDNDYATVKYDASGVQQWVARYDGPGNYIDIATALALDGSGNVYVTGRSIGAGTFNDYATVKYDASGVQQWVARYNTPGNDHDYASALAIDASGNVYVTGGSRGSGTSNDYATVKYDVSGVQQWVARYDGPGNGSDEASALVLDASGNVYVTGRSSGAGTDYDYATVRYGASGVQQWVARYDGPGNDADEASALALDASGNVYVTGRSSGAGTDYDYATVRYDASGVQQWVARYDGPGNSSDYATALAINASDNVYVTGYSSAGGSSQYSTVKYIQIPTSVRYPGTGVPEAFSLSQNYPNPFNPSTNFRFRIGHFGFVLLKVYDVLGNEVATLVNEEMKPGRYEVRWDASGMASGVYFYRLEAGSFSETKKLFFLR